MADAGDSVEPRPGSKSLSYRDWVKSYQSPPAISAPQKVADWKAEAAFRAFLDRR